jgi:hypothetical protein
MLENRVPRRIAGSIILLIAVLSGLGNFGAVQPLADPMTSTELTSAGGSLRLGIIALSLVAALDVLVAIVLYKVFRSAGTRLVSVVRGLRIAYAAGLALAISQLIPILSHLDGNLAGESTAARQASAETGVERFNDVWHVALLLFGLHLIGLAIAARTTRMPRVLLVLLVIAGGGYALDSVSNLLTGTSPGVSAYTFIGEFTLALWLVAGRRRSTPQHHHGLHPGPALA